MDVAIAEEVGVRPMVWDKAEFYRLAESGFFDGRKVELIGGVLMVHSPQKPAHADRLDRVGDVLRAAFGVGFRVRCQLPLDLGQTVEPEPDHAVVADASYAAGHPTAAALIVEIADSSLAYDRETKAGLYAAGGVADYWIVNLVDEQVEVHRTPVPDPSRPFGHRYDDVTAHRAGDAVAPLAAAAVVAVAELLP